MNQINLLSKASTRLWLVFTQPVKSTFKQEVLRKLIAYFPLVRHGLH
jgi:hypothetical protein